MTKHEIHAVELIIGLSLSFRFNYMHVTEHLPSCLYFIRLHEHASLVLTSLISLSIEWHNFITT